MNLFFFFLKKEHSTIRTIKPSLQNLTMFLPVLIHRWGLPIMRYPCILGSGPTLMTSLGAGSNWARDTHLWLWHGLLLWPNLLTSGFSPFCQLMNLSKHHFSRITPTLLKNFSKAPVCLQDKVRGLPSSLQSLLQSGSRSYLPLGVHTNPLLPDHESTQAGAFNEDWLIHGV